MSTRCSKLKISIPITAMMMSMAMAHADPAASSGKTIDLALVTWVPASHNMEEAADECPDGVNKFNSDSWKKQFPTEEDQAKFIEDYIHLGPTTAGGGVPSVFYQNRAPNGAHAAYNPTMVQDDPVHEVQTKVAYGLNLDGTTDGRATPNTCAHETFVSPSGESGVDNQLYRANGCWTGWRRGGFNSTYHSVQFLSSTINRVLISVTGVDNEQNDDDVEVAVYKGFDPVGFDGDGNPVPWLTHRIDTRYPRYNMARTRGKIVDGVLKTEPVDIRFALYQMNSESERFMRGVRLELKLGDGTAEGLLAGYEDLHQWWRGTRNSYVDVVDSVSYWNPPATYEAVHRLADGYPDPESGQCTAISAAYAVTAVRAFIIHPPEGDPLLADPLVAQGIVER